MTKIYIATLGCPKNRVDSEKTLWALRNAGAELTADQTQADVLLVNTCGFIEDAKEESIDAILELAQVKKHGGQKLAVMGCLSERYRGDLAEQIPEIDYIYGVSELEQVARDLSPASPAKLPDPDAAGRLITTGPHWAYLKIAEGCSNNCSFCVIPSIRGPYKSFGPEELVREAEDLASRGVKELIVVAQDTTLYGSDIRSGGGLAGLLQRLEKIDDLSWIRVLYMYPPLLDAALLETIAWSEKIAPYFDIPFQHGSDRILKRMRRGETNESIRALAANIRSAVPGAAIRSSFITGFPGETESDFEILLKLAEDLRLDHAGAFVYSPEEGSEAFTLDGAVEIEVARERRERLMETQREVSASLTREKIGSVAEVIVDGMDPDDSLLLGRTKLQAPDIDGSVILDGVEAEPGSIIRVRITGATDYDLIGETAE